MANMDFGQVDMPSPLDIMMGSRLPPELMQRIAPLMAMSQMEIDARNEGLNQLSQYQQQLQDKATTTRKQFNQEVNKPLPIDANLMAINQAVGSFAEALSPKGRFAEKAAQRREQEIGFLKEQRLERLKMMQQDVITSANQADQMGDVMAKQRAMTKSENLGIQMNALRSGLSDYYKAKDAMALKREEAQQRLREIYLKWNLDNTGSLAKIPPQVQMRLKTEDDMYDKQFKLLQDKSKAIDQNIMLDPEKKKAAQDDIMKQMGALTQDHMVTKERLLNANQTLIPPDVPKQTVSTATPDQVVMNYVGQGQLDLNKMIKDIQDEFSQPGRSMPSHLGVTPGTPEAEAAKAAVIARARVLVPQITAKVKRLATITKELDFLNRNPNAPLRQDRLNGLMEEYQQLQKTFASYGIEVGGRQAIVQ